MRERPRQAVSPQGGGQGDGLHAGSARRRSPSSSATAASAWPTRPSARCSPCPTAAATYPLVATIKLNWSIRVPGSPTCSPGSTISPSRARTSCCLGTGRMGPEQQCAADRGATGGRHSPRLRWPAELQPRALADARPSGGSRIRATFAPSVGRVPRRLAAHGHGVVIIASPRLRSGRLALVYRTRFSGQ